MMIKLVGMTKFVEMTKWDVSFCFQVEEILFRYKKTKTPMNAEFCDIYDTRYKL